MTSTELVPIHESSSWVEVMAPAAKLAADIANTEFVPGPLRNKPAAVAACILTGHEVGIGPMQALAKIHVVDGRPAMAAELMRALVLRDGHDIWVDELTTTRCKISGKRAGSEHTSTVTWTMDDAKRANLAGKNNWRRYPRAMLQARATAELCRLIFADCLGGISYVPDELEDEEVFAERVDEAEPEAKPKKKRTAQRRSAAKKKDEPAAEPAAAEPPAETLGADELLEEAVAEALGETADSQPDADEAVSSPDRGPLEDLQLACLIRIRELVDEDDDTRHAVVRYVTKGRAESSRDLTEDECRGLLRTLDAVEDGSVFWDFGAEKFVQTSEPPAAGGVQGAVEEPAGSGGLPFDPLGLDAGGWKVELKARGVTQAGFLRELSTLARDLDLESVASLAGLAAGPDRLKVAAGEWLVAAGEPM